MQEKLFLRAFTNETYLWYDEVPDRNPSFYSSIIAYFHSLVTSETTATGKTKDRFHFAIPYEDEMKSSQSGLVAGFDLIGRSFKRQSLETFVFLIRKTILQPH